MKELEKLTREKLELHAEQNQRVENKFIGTAWIRTGLKLFVYNKEEDKMSEIPLVKKGMVGFDGQVIEAKKAQYNPRHLYFQAINEKNARRKLKRYLAGEYNLSETFEPKEFEQLSKYF